MRTDPYPEPSFHAFIFCSNEDWFLPANSNSRRYMALELDNRWVGKETPESKAYFEPIWAIKIENLAHFLYNRDISKFDPRQVPITDLLQEQAAFSLSSVETFVRNHMEVGDFVVRRDHIEDDRTYSWNDWILQDTLYQMYKKEMGGGYGMRNESWFWRDLTKICDFDRRIKSSRPQIKFKKTLVESVAEWNAKRGDNVNTQKIDVVS